MSWLAKSIISSLTDNEENSNEHKYEEEATTVRGVKEDITELTETLSRQFRGFASFLAPHPPSDLSDPSADDAGPNMAGIRSDLVEIGGKFRSGIEKISNAKETVSEISKMASSLLMVGNEDSDDDDFGKNLDGVAGIDDEIVEFVMSVSMRPEIWLDFPLNYDEEEDHDNDDFEMTDAQQEHALAVERLVPALSSLRIELCPSHMSEGHFWKIYFLLLHARLNKKDADLLITTKIEQARATLLHDMPNKSERATTSEMSVDVVAINPSKETSMNNDTCIDDASVAAEETIISTRNDSNKIIANDDAFTSIPITDTVETETEKDAAQTIDDDSFTSIPITDNMVESEKKINEEEVVDKSVIQEQHYDDVTGSVQGDEDENDEWLQGEDGVEAEEAGTDGQRRDIQVVHDEDISFSDLEEDDDGHKAAPKNH